MFKFVFVALIALTCVFPAQAARGRFGLVGRGRSATVVAPVAVNGGLFGGSGVVLDANGNVVPVGSEVIVGGNGLPVVGLGRGTGVSRRGAARATRPARRGRR